MKGKRSKKSRALPAAEHVRRGTVQPCRVRSKPAKPRAVGTKSEKTRNFTAIADRYVDDILCGRIAACRWTKLACERFQRMRQAPKSSTSTIFTWSPAHVQDVCAFVEKLPHVEGRWSSATLTLEPWQTFILAAVYGFRRPDASRLVSTVFFEVGRKSAKSTLVAGAALYHLAVENEPGAQVVCGATTGNQARIVFSIMARMVKRSLWLRKAGFTAYANAIVVGEGGGTAKPINAKSSTQDGLNPSFISLDESHAQTFELHDVLKSAQGARADAMLMAPTTAGYTLTSVGYALRQTAMKILDGVIESPHTFCCLYELDEADDWRNQSTWIKALPMLGTTPSLDYVKRYRDDAIATPGLAGEFQVKMCNRWLSSASSWLSVPAWQRCVDVTFKLQDFAGERCFVGVDLAERDDIAAVALAFQRDDLIYLFVRGYLPELVIGERARAVPQYREWLEAGELIATSGNLTDYGVIEADLRADCERFDVQDLVIERFGALHLASNLLASGLPAKIESKNAKVFTAPAKELEARIRAGKLRHTGSAFLTWQISNCCVERRRDGSLLPTKDMPDSANKIDAVDAVCLAISALISASTAPVAEPRIWMLEA